jgi:hypothetical protein
VDGRNKSGHDGYRLQLPSQSPYWLYQDFQPDSREPGPAMTMEMPFAYSAIRHVFNVVR